MKYANVEIYELSRLQHIFNKPNKEINKLIKKSDFPNVYLEIKDKKYWKKKDIQAYLEKMRES